jgi:hypothetical protein
MGTEELNNDSYEMVVLAMHTCNHRSANAIPRRRWGLSPGLEAAGVRYFGKTRLGSPSAAQKLSASPSSPPPVHDTMAATVEISLPLPVLPEGWAGEKDFKSVGQLNQATDRNIEPVGPHFLAYARRVRHLIHGIPNLY